jgi:5-(carboxyamino)imidazole ribonucleotide synthase
MPVVGVIGGGQLARMIQPAAIALGVELRVFAEAANSSAHLSATRIGDYNNFEELEEFCQGLDALTFDHEHVPKSVLDLLVATGVQVRPGPNALIHAQNKLTMRAKLAALGLPMPSWKSVTTEPELESFISSHGPEVVVKTPIGGYDGKGVKLVSSATDVSAWFSEIDSFGSELLAEEKVLFTGECAQLIARSPSGEIKLWPLVKTIQVGGVCSEVIAPYGTSEQTEAAAGLAVKIAEGLGVTGVMAVELFELASGELLVNELAMRPHNSGHFTIDGSVTSQFEQHLRAVLDLPLGATDLKGAAAVMINLLGVDDRNSFVEHYPIAMKNFPEAKFHLYEKSPRLGRKMGHINLVGSDAQQLLVSGREAREVLYRGSKEA